MTKNHASDMICWYVLNIDFKYLAVHLDYTIIIFSIVG